MGTADSPSNNTGDQVPDNPPPYAGDPKVPLNPGYDYYYPEYFPWSDHWDHPDAIYSGEHIPYLGGSYLILDGRGQNAWFRMSVNPDIFNGTDADESVWGRGGDDQLHGNGGRDMIYGEYGNDIIWGGAGRDFLDGGSGNDILYGEGDSDLMSGGLGNDSLIGGAGNDEIYGDWDDDLLSDGIGRNWLDGGDGSDTIGVGLEGGVGNAEVNLETGYARTALGMDRLFNFENITAGAGNDLLVGDGNRNNVFGGEGDDRLFGQGGDDALDGGGGNDFLSGGEGNDILLSQVNYGERDTLNGGAGADTFRVEGDYGFTVIEDFHSGEDTLDLSWYGAFLPAGYGPSDLIGTASETPAGLLLDVMTIEEPDEIHHSYILLSGIDRTEISTSDVDLWA